MPVTIAITTTTTVSRCAAAITPAAGSSKSGSPLARPINRRSLRTFTAKAHEYECVELKDLQHMAPITQTQRSVSCFELGSAERRYQTIRIGKDSAELQQLAQTNVTQLLQTATSPIAGDSINARLARKALRYRKIWTPETENCLAAAVTY